jgi:lysophospholipase L1-like esterase
MASWSEGSKRLLLVAASTLVGVILLVAGFEVAARVRYARWRNTYNTGRWFFRLTVASANPVLGWEYRRGRIRASGDIRINGNGFREREGVTLEKPPGVLRVAFVGDSITLGMEVAEPETFVRRFEVLANRSGAPSRVEALNFGVGGYDAVQVAELLCSRVMAFGPDRVVYVLCWNDFDFEDASRSMALYFKPPRSFFLAALKDARRRLSGTEYHHAHFAETRDIVFGKIREMRDLVAARHGRLWVAVVPVFSPCQPGGPELARAWDPDPLADLQEVLAGFLKANAIPFVDLRPAFRASGLPPDAVARDAWHPNAEGSRIIAEALLAPVLELPVPGP